MSLGLVPETLLQLATQSDSQLQITRWSWEGLTEVVVAKLPDAPEAGVDSYFARHTGRMLTLATGFRNTVDLGLDLAVLFSFVSESKDLEPGMIFEGVFEKCVPSHPHAVILPPWPWPCFCSEDFTGAVFFSMPITSHERHLLEGGLGAFEDYLADTRRLYFPR